MKIRLLSIAVAAAAAFVAPASASAQASSMSSEHHAKSGWKELDAYHDLMAATWHPAKNNDLKPIRAKADSLAASAKVWGATKAPHGCDSKEITDAIAAVVKGSADVAKLVSAKASDADVRKALHDVHETFEVVEKGCKPAHH